MLGLREPEIYGRKSFEEYFEGLQMEYPGVTLHYFQSNHEGDLIDKIQEANLNYQGIILNAGGYSHTSIALADAISAVETAVVEVHISNIYSREAYRKNSLTASRCDGCITGLGLKGYALAIEYFID